MSTLQRFLPMVVAVLSMAAPVHAQDVRIIAADGRLAASGRVGELRVRPGQVISLTADEVLAEDGQVRYGYRAVGDFLWSADDTLNDTCDPVTDCRKTSHFEVTDYGVNFYVPWDAPQRVTLTATLKWGDAHDVVTLDRDVAAEPGHAEASLQGLGYWVSIGGTRVFVPSGYDAEWAPYQHGYWYWTSFGWTWYSFDPWGEVTDHCGHWRHSWAYGWVWLPGEVCTWRPAVVSFFYGFDFVGWYPYDPGWGWGYRHGFADGYDDGYWMGYWAGRGAYAMHPGLTSVRYPDFYVPGGHAEPPHPSGARVHAAVADVSRVRLADPEAVRAQFLQAVGASAVGPLPGAKDASKAHAFMAERLGLEPTETGMKPAWDDGRGHAWMTPERAPHETPADYQGIRRRTLDLTQGLRRDVPAVRMPLAPGSGVPGREVRPQGEAGRGSAIAPRSTEPSGSAAASWSPRGHNGASPADRARINPEARPEPRPFPATERTLPSATERTVPQATERTLPPATERTMPPAIERGRPVAPAPTVEGQGAARERPVPDVDRPTPDYGRSLPPVDRPSPVPSPSSFRPVAPPPVQVRPEPLITHPAPAPAPAAPAAAPTRPKPLVLPPAPAPRFERQAPTHERPAPSEPRSFDPPSRSSTVAGSASGWGGNSANSYRPAPAAPRQAPPPSFLSGGGGNGFGGGRPHR